MFLHSAKEKTLTDPRAGTCIQAIQQNKAVRPSSAARGLPGEKLWDRSAWQIGEDDAIAVFVKVHI